MKAIKITTRAHKGLSAIYVSKDEGWLVEQDGKKAMYSWTEFIERFQAHGKIAQAVITQAMLMDGVDEGGEQEV